MSEQVKSKGRITSLLEILFAATKLGLTSFGGPVAHLAYFKDEYIDRRKWLSEKTYADIIAICQFLPGPASSQVGIAIGILRGGLLGGIISFLGFTLPSIIVLVIFALLYQSFSLEGALFIQSLKIVAVAVVLHALIGLGKKLTPDKTTIAIAVASAIVMLLYPSAWIQILIIIIAGLVGLKLFQNKAESNIESFDVNISKRMGITALLVLISALMVLPILNNIFNHSLLNIFDIFFSVGSLVFVGGYFVLPLIEGELVRVVLISCGEFLAAYGLAQAVPGPLFTFASYLGTMMEGVTGAVIATIAIFLPSFLLIVAALPFLSELRQHASFQSILIGVNASVVGILLAAFYDPVIKSSIVSGADFALALILFALLNVWKTPAWLIVIIGVLGGYFFNLLGF